MSGQAGFQTTDALPPFAGVLVWEEDEHGNEWLTCPKCGLTDGHRVVFGQQGKCGNAPSGCDWTFWSEP